MANRPALRALATQLKPSRDSLISELPRRVSGQSSLNQQTVDLGQRVRTLRAARRLTLKNVAERSGLSVSSLSKIENNQLSPTYVSIVRLAQGLGADIAELFSDKAGQRSVPSGRRSITRAGKGQTFRTSGYDYEMLCSDVVGKHIIPVKVRVKAREVRDVGPLVAHEGEEVIYVLSGRIELVTELYESIQLGPGDCVFFDSTMGHLCLACGDEDAEVFWMCSSQHALSVLDARRSERGLTMRKTALKSDRPASSPR
jgi:transcriptional regulator with XRE-family HTH domain